MSSSATRLCTMSRKSVATSRPVTPPAHRPRSLRARTKTMTMRAVPKTADMMRHPKVLKPKTLIPIAMIHLPRGGWT